MNTEWFKGLTQEEKAKKKDLLKANKKVLKELSAILESKKICPKKEDYSNPNWAYYRADMDGYNRALTTVLNIIDLEKD